MTKHSGDEKWLGKRVGHFRLLGLLGRGAMGHVFLAEDTQLKRRIALKVFRIKKADKSLQQQLDVFLTEARSAAKLDHPHVVRIYEVKQVDDLFYIAMELIEGGDLSEVVKANGPMQVSQACLLCAEAADALDYAHQMGVIHRDIKPANLMIDRKGRCKVADFGLAKLDDPDEPKAIDTEAVGTPKFVAPEVAQNQPATSASEVYSLAASLWFLLTGKAMYQGKTEKELLKQHVEAPVPDLHALRPELPEPLIELIYSALSKSPARRPQTCAAFAEALREFIDPGDMSASDLGLSSSSGFSRTGLGQSAEPVAHPHRPWLGWGVAVIALLSMAMAGMNIFNYLQGQSQNNNATSHGVNHGSSDDASTNSKVTGDEKADTNAAGDASTKPQ